MHSIHAPHRAALAVATLCAAFAAHAASADKAPVTRYHVVAVGDENTYVAAINKGGSIAATVSTNAALFDPDLVATPLPTLVPGGWATAMAVNTRGTVAGSANAANGLERAVLWRKGKVVNLGTLPGDKNYNSYAAALNNVGQVLVTEYSDDNYARSFVWASGSKTEIAGLPGSTSVYATGLNDAGHIAGYTNIASDRSAHSYLIRDGVTIDLGALAPGGRIAAMAINADDMIVGGAALGPVTDDSRPPLHAFAWKDGVMTDLGNFTGNNTIAYAVNRKGAVVGAAFLLDSATPDDSVAFVHEGLKMVDLNKRLDADSAGWQLKMAYGIDDAGQIIGTGTLNGVSRSFLATPVK
jgi:probable HAF family extracellular repeat protein